MKLTTLNCQQNPNNVVKGLEVTCEERVSDPDRSAEDRSAWTDFNRAANNLTYVLQTRGHTLHALMLNDTDLHLKKVKRELDRQDKLYRWRGEVRAKGGHTT